MWTEEKGHREKKDRAIGDRWYLLTADPVRDGAGLLMGAVSIMVDIMERRRDEVKLKLLDRVISMVNNLVLVANERGEIIYASPSVYSMLGYSPEEVLGEGWLALARKDSEDREREKRYLSATAKGEVEVLSIPYERKIYDKWGHPHWILWQDTKGPGNSIIGIGAEITEHKRVDEKVRRQNEYLAALHETALALMNRLELEDLLKAIVMHAAVLVGTQHGFIHLTEPGETEMVLKLGVGIYSNKFIGDRIKPGEGLAGKVWQTGQPLVVNGYRAWPDRLPDPYLATFQAVVGVPIKFGSQVVGVIGLVHLEEGRTFGDEEIAVLSQFAGLASMALNNARLHTSVQQELDRRKRTEEALRQSEERYRAVVEQTAEGIYLADAKTRRVLESNEAFQRLLGYTSEETLDLTVYDFVAHDRESIDLRIQHLLMGKLLAGERQYRRKDGSLIDVEVTANTISYGGREVFCTVVRDITNRKQAEEQVKASLKEKEVLLKEIHHRVKNNLQVIYSLLDLQSNYIKDPQALRVFKEGQNRIRSMALIHEKLYQSRDLAKIDFAKYLQSLTDHLFRSYGVDPETITLRIYVEDVFLGVDTAIPCGLIINELVSNSLKYAFPTGRNGEIVIDLRSDRENNLTLTIRDNGVGLPKDLDLQNTMSLGLQLVTLLSAQLGGTLALDRRGGTAFKITFKER